MGEIDIINVYHTLKGNNSSIRPLTASLVEWYKFSQSRITFQETQGYVLIPLQYFSSSANKRTPKRSRNKTFLTLQEIELGEQSDSCVNLSCCVVHYGSIHIEPMRDIYSVQENPNQLIECNMYDVIFWRLLSTKKKSSIYQCKPVNLSDDVYSDVIARWNQKYHYALNLTPSNLKMLSNFFEIYCINHRNQKDIIAIIISKREVFNIEGKSQLCLKIVYSIGEEINKCQLPEILSNLTCLPLVGYSLGVTKRNNLDNRYFALTTLTLSLSFEIIDDVNLMLI